MTGGEETPTETLTVDGLGAHLHQGLHVFGQVFVKHLLPDAPRVQRLQGAVKLLGILDPPPASHHRCRTGRGQITIRTRDSIMGAVYFQL